MPASVLVLLLLLLACFSSNEGAKKVVKEKAKVTTPTEETVISSNVYSLELQYAIGTDGSFKTRGILQTTSFKASSVIKLEQDPLTGDEFDELKRAAQNGDFYFLRAKNNFTSDSINTETNYDQKNDIVMTIVSACALLKSQLNDKILIQGDSQGNVISLSILPAKPVLETGLDCTDYVPTRKLLFNTKVQYAVAQQGPIPQTQAFLQKQEAEKAKKENEDNRSFFQKYWLYIIIGIVAIQFLGGMGGGGGGS